MKQIFEPTSIGSLQLKNRLVRSATWENKADDRGHLTPQLSEVYEQLAAGGVGLIITGYAFVLEQEQPNPGMMGIYADSFIDEYRQLTQRVHELGGKIVLQIAYGGSQTGYPPEEGVIWGPSAVADLATGVVPTPMSREDIQTVVTAFGDAAARAKAAGFDGVQLHGAHSYLLSQFFNPYYNRRSDDYGGSVENRARITLEVYDEVRQRVGQDYPVMIKINGDDFVAGGATVEDSLVLSQFLAARGMDAIEVSGGTGGSADKIPARTRINSPDKEGYHVAQAECIAKAVEIPVMVVGGFRSPQRIEQTLDSTEIELVSLARPLLAEPDLPKRWQGGDRTKARCVSCNGCLQSREGGNNCILNKKG